MSVGAAINLGADELGDNIGDVRHEHREVGMIYFCISDNNKIYYVHYQCKN
jgi:hypothetical protein